MFALKLQPQKEAAPEPDNRVVLSGLSWSDYQRLLELRGEASVPRFAFLRGQLEIMTPSLSHESIKSRIGCLVEVSCLERNIEFSPCGSWTLENKSAEAGLEPDECYVFGTTAAPVRPDLAIEVLWTSGGVKKLDIYQQLGLREVWFWRKNRISIHLLDDDTHAYVEARQSRALPGIDLEQLVTFLDRPSASQAMREYRALLSAAAGQP